MEKDFNTWNEYKKLLDKDQRMVDFHERELWWLSFGINVGVEINGKSETFERPCLILKKFNKQMAWVLPATSQRKDPRFYAGFTLHNQEYFIALTQLRTISVERLSRKEGMISKNEFMHIKQSIIEFLINERRPT